MNEIRLIAFQLPTKNYIVFDGMTGMPIVQNVTQKYLDTNAIHSEIKKIYGDDVKWNMTFILFDDWKEFKVGDKVYKRWTN